MDQSPEKGGGGWVAVRLFVLGKWGGLNKRKGKAETVGRNFDCVVFHQIVGCE